MMNKISKITFAFAICALILISVYQAASACQVDEFYTTKEGSLIATTPEILNEAVKYEEVDNKDKLAELLSNGSVLRLKGNIKVQVLERSVEFKTLKIKYLNQGSLYWVKDGSLKQINCQ
jgi:hypothetical protein